ncbi:MAG: ABC transporter substrate-binding protein [Spirochaetota bacterium]
MQTFSKFVFVLLTLLLFSCYRKESNVKEHLVISIPSDPTKVDPVFATDLTSQKLSLLVYTGLFRTNTNAEPIAELISSYTKESKQKILFTLKDVKFPNGESLLAKDVVFSLKRLRNTPGPKRSQYKFLQEIQAVNSQQFYLTITIPTEKALALLSLPPATIYSQRQFETKQKFLSAAKYYLAKWHKNDSLVLVKNPYHLSPTAIPAKITLKVVAESSIGIYLFSKEKLDAMKIPYFLIDHTVAKEHEIQKIRSRSIQYVAINQRKPCFDRFFRQAINYAIDKRLIIDKIFAGEAEFSYGPVPSSYIVKDKLNAVKLRENFYPYNLQKAHKLLQQSKCYPQIKQQTLDFRMKADDENKAKGASIVQFLKDLGLQVKLNPMEKAIFYKQNGQGKGDLTLLTWYIDYDSKINFLDPLFASNSFGSGGNRSFYKNTKVDNLLSKLQQEKISLNEKEQLFWQTLGILKKDAPWVYLWSLNENYLLSNKVKELANPKQYLF